MEQRKNCKSGSRGFCVYDTISLQEKDESEMDVERKTGTDKSVDNVIKDRNVPEVGDYTGEELKFAVFCIENVAARLRVDASVIYDIFTRNSNILENYIIPCYDVLHTQGKDYIVNDLLDRLKEKGVIV